MARPRPRHTAAALLLAAVGCTTDAGRRDGRTDDPLLGSGLRPANQPLAVVTANPPGSAVSPPQPAYQPRPPVTPGMPTSNAALATGGFQPLPGSNDLRIGDGSPTLGAPPANVQPASDPRLGTPATPTGLSSPTPAGGPVPVPPPTAAAGGRGGLDQAMAAVVARNPLYYRLDYNSQAREYLFKMSVTDRLNTSVQRTVEGSAPAPADAIYRALEQLGNEP